MRDDWLHLKDLEGGLPLILPTEPFVLHSFTAHICSRITSMVGNSLHQSRFAASVVFLLNGGSSSNLVLNHNGLKSGSRRFSVLVKKFTSRIGMDKVAGFMMRFLHREAERLQSLPMLSIAAILVPPMDNLSLNVLDGEGAADKRSDTVSRRPCEVGIRGCAGLLFPDFHRIKYKVEPRTGIEFPMVLDNLDGEPIFSPASEILVGTGSRTMKIVKIKSLKVYAYGFYIHPDTVCEKLGPKYASLSASDLNVCNSFYQDLLREDIGMTVRLVVNCNGMKINTVRDAFEKSLRARLLKTNPNTDYDCLNEFGSVFPNDIALPVGTTIDFHRTANGSLVTEIGGSKIGAVQSKDLCKKSIPTKPTVKFELLIILSGPSLKKLITSAQELSSICILETCLYQSKRKKKLGKMWWVY